MIRMLSSILKNNIKAKHEVKQWKLYHARQCTDQ